VLWRGEHGGHGVLVAGTEPPEVVELWDWTLAPGDRHASEPHAAGTRELIHIHNGQLIVELPDQQLKLNAGDAAAFAGDVIHAYCNTADGTTTFSMAVYEPGVRPGFAGA
jgi:quercetin dioxygenase-like cupin family protein